LLLPIIGRGCQLGQEVQRGGAVRDGDAGISSHRQSRVTVAGKFHHHAGRYVRPADCGNVAMPEGMEVQHKPARIAGQQEIGTGPIITFLSRCRFFEPSIARPGHVFM
jgi:hypothetical protein